MIMLKKQIKDLIAGLLLFAGLVLLFCALDQLQVTGNTDSAARKLTRVLEKQTDKLEGYMEEALNQNPGQWLDLESLPEDMVIYRYCADTLQSWVNEFPIANDDIRTRILVPFVSNPYLPIISPLSQLDETESFIEMGQKWYIAKSISNEYSRVIGAFEVINTQDITSFNGANPKLKLRDEYTIRPVAVDGGSPVFLDGKAQFQVLCENIIAARTVSPFLVWVSLLLILGSSIFFLYNGKTLKRLKWTLALLLLVLFFYYFWGKTINAHVILFSPLLYAGNEVLYSLGSVVLINLMILVLALSLYITRRELTGKLINNKKALICSAAVITALCVLIVIYTHLSLRSIIRNSGISLELYKLSELTPFCFVVYASYITMLLSLPMLLQLIQAPVAKYWGLGYDMFSVRSRTVFSVIISAYLVGHSAILGFEKEEQRLELLSNRLSFDRDISLEFYLRRIENQIADDMIISALSVFHNTEASIQARIRETYMMRNNQDYTVTAYVFNKDNNTRAAANLYNSLLDGAAPISDDSRFFYVKKDNGNPYYIGVFFYLIEGSGISRVLVKFESDEVQSSRGYAGIFGISPPGKVTIPSGYSYARYEGKTLKSYKGSFAYPLEIDIRTRDRIFGDKVKHITSDDYTHFFTLVGDREVIVLSRTRISALTYVVSVIFISLMVFLIMTLAVFGKKKEKIFDQSYYRNRISMVLLVSLLCTLLAMASVSVLFVYSRNEANMRSVMYDKIISVTTMLGDGFKDVRRTSEMNMAEVQKLLEQVGADTNSDITLYAPDGKMMTSTSPMVFNRQLIEERLDGNAYGRIVYNRDSHFIQKESLGAVSFYSMYSPIVNSFGDIIAIVSSPYSEDSYDFEEDAVMHSMTIVSLFLVFLLIALFVVSKVVDRMFHPLSEMSDKMNSAGLDSLEHIDYQRNDEVSSIVKAYNSMVTQLSDSTKKLAQAERDKAWSEMARQVAHEIKNPLTPMKLQLQRVIRLKEKGNPAWQERFDEASKVLLDHIDILTDTANEFSTFAKLYSEEHTVIALDELIREEIALFDNRDDVCIEYIGLDNVKVEGPKPQLTRVFVNLLNNAIQAVAEQEAARVTVSLRKSIKDGFYDIVFEDNGPGVSSENVHKLFTPNFTTKNSGSGLGLAISRSILERCGATINYSKSFTLGGACFTIVYPGLEAISDGSISAPDSH